MACSVNRYAAFHELPSLDNAREDPHNFGLRCRALACSAVQAGMDREAFAAIRPLYEWRHWLQSPEPLPRLASSQQGGRPSFGILGWRQATLTRAVMGDQPSFPLRRCIPKELAAVPLMSM
jgi:hypothetical protein